MILKIDSLTDPRIKAQLFAFNAEKIVCRIVDNLKNNLQKEVVKMSYYDLVCSALFDLKKAIEEMCENTFIPERSKRFYFCDNVVWPWTAGNTDKVKSWYYMLIDNQLYCISSDILIIVDKIIHYAHYQPRKILRALRRIQAATAWCLARAAHGLELSP